MQPHNSAKASFFRTALLLGLLPGSCAVEWADSVIAGTTSVPHAFLDLATTRPDDITALRYALLEIGTEEVAEDVLRAILGLVLRDIESGKRSMHDSVMVLSQFRRFTKLSSAVAEQILEFEMYHSEAVHAGTRAETEEKILAWLVGFKNDEEKFLFASANNGVDL
jgi:hypothetical protein